MFERYTETGRRAIFFARYESSQHSGKAIEPPHMLLGLLREDRHLFSRLLPEATVENVRIIRERIAAKLPPEASVTVTEDIPFSHAVKNILAHAAEEADRMNNPHIGTQHILLGILLQQEAITEEIFHELGIDLESARQKLAKIPC